MDTTSQSPILTFLLKAKRATYASSDDADQLAGAQQPASRSASHDLAYREGDFFYLDTYLGGFSFAGEEAVWQKDIPLWSMNYYGTMVVDEIPEGFGHFLKLCLRQSPPHAPYRGPEHFESGRFSYTCSWEGRFEHFQGKEGITLDGVLIYTLSFHGGSIR
jgi:hypothetical protein